LELLLTNPDEIKNHIKELQEWKKIVYTPSNLLIIYERLYSNLMQPKSLEIDITPVPSSEKERFDVIYNLLESNGVTCALINKNCVDAVKFGKPAEGNTIIELGVSDFQKARQILKDNKLYNTNIHLENFKGKTKKLGYLGTARNVPFPVIGYLDRLYDKNWRD